MDNIWTDALEGLQPRLGQRTYDLWLRPLVFRGVEGDRLRLGAPSQFMKEWFENHYLEVVLDEIHAQTARRFGVDIDVDPQIRPVLLLNPELAKPAPAAEPIPAPAAQRTLEATVAAPVEPPAAPVPLGLSERYTFDTFIKGGSNELAASAAWSVAHNPGDRFNPLFIYGGVGLGKTHLLHAIAHELHGRHPTLRIAYLSAERFMNEFITAVRFNEFEAFRARYRSECDVLLIDDIQFIAGRDRTMDEFFHVFNALHENGKQIVVAADRTPAEMVGMEERVTSRLNWGLVADVKAPDLETRAAILRQRADAERIELSDEVAVAIAQRVRSNVRELEGALLRIATFSALRGVEISRELVLEVLGGPPPDAAPPITIDAVQKAVASHFSVRVADLKGPRRHQGISRPRMLAMYLTRQLTGSSFPEIGQRFDKDHSTVINACRRIEAMLQTDAELRVLVNALRDRLTGVRSA